MMQDEVKVGKPCSFYVMIAEASIPFSCQTSTDYQEWMAAFNLATDLAQLNQADPSQPQLVNKWLADVAQSEP